MKLSKRLQIIANIVEKKDFIADVGCDHAYLCIYLALNNSCENIIATEINAGPYNIALNNIKKYKVEDKIKLYLTDGLVNINEYINTIILAGMGATTITNILSNYNYLNKVNKLIIQSNNDWEHIRRFLNKNGYYIEKEYYTYENKKDYITILAKKSENKNTEEELIIGLYDLSLKEFYIKQIDKLENILKKIKNKEDINYIKIAKKIKILKTYIN